MNHATYTACQALKAPLELLEAYSLALVRREDDPFWHREALGRVGCPAARSGPQTGGIRRNHDPISLLRSGDQLCPDPRCAWPEAARLLIELFEAAASAGESFEFALAHDDADAERAALDRLADIEERAGAATTSFRYGTQNTRVRLFAVAEWVSRIAAERSSSAARTPGQRYALAALRLAGAFELTIDRDIIKHLGITWAVANEARSAFLAACSKLVAPERLAVEVLTATRAAADALLENPRSLEAAVPALIAAWRAEIEEITLEDPAPSVPVLLEPGTGSSRDSEGAGDLLALQSLTRRAWGSRGAGDGRSFVLVPPLVAAHLGAARGAT